MSWKPLSHVRILKYQTLLINHLTLWPIVSCRVPRIVCACNSQLASRLLQICVLCSSMTLSNIPLEIKKNIQLMKISEIGEILYGSWLKLCTDHPTSLVFLSFLIKFHWGKSIEWTAFYNGFFSETKYYFPWNEVRNQLVPFSSIPWLWTFFIATHKNYLQYNILQFTCLTSITLFTTI